MSAPTAIRVAPHGGNPIIRAIGFLSTVSGVIAAIGILTAVLITCQMIWMRFVLNQSTIWQTEAVTYIMIGATMLGLPYVQRLRGHVNVDLLPILLPPMLRKALAILTLSAAVVIVGIMTWYGFEFWHFAWERGWRTDTVWAIKLWIPYLTMPVGFGLYLLQLIADLWVLLAGHEQPFGIEEKN